MKKTGFFVILAILGFGLLAAGLLLLKLSEGDADVAPYLCVGCGCGIFGHGIGELLSRRAAKKDPAGAKQRTIEENDERNIALRNRAQAKAYNLMVPVFGALFMAFALMKVDMAVVLLLVAAYIFVCGSSVYYRIKYEKEM